MKKIETIQKEIDHIIALMKQKARSNEELNLPKPKFTKENSRIQYLNTIIAFLETNPTDEYLHKEQTRLETLIRSLRDGFENWLAPTGIVITNRLKYYQEHVGINKLSKQLSTINFILS